MYDERLSSGSHPDGPGLLPISRRPFPLRPRTSPPLKGAGMPAVHEGGEHGRDGIYRAQDGLDEVCRRIDGAECNPEIFPGLIMRLSHRG